MLMKKRLILGSVGLILVSMITTMIILAAKSPNDQTKNTNTTKSENTQNDKSSETKEAAVDNKNESSPNQNPKPQIDTTPAPAQPQPTQPSSPPAPANPTPAPAPQPQPAPVPTPDPNRYDVGPPDKVEIVELVNTERLKRGKNALTMISTINASAQEQADFMASISTMTHDGAKDRILKHTPSCIAALAENVQFSSSQGFTSRVAVNAWLNSPGHFANMLGDYSRTGVGIAQKDDIYITYQCNIVNKERLGLPLSRFL